MKPESTAQSENTADLRSVHTSNLPELLDRLGISLIVSTYQAGKAIVVRNDNGKLNTHFRTFAKPMGITADQARLTIGGANTVWWRARPTTLVRQHAQWRATAHHLGDPTVFRGARTNH
jgi:hypothetical protein